MSNNKCLSSKPSRCNNNSSSSRCRCNNKITLTTISNNIPNISILTITSNITTTTTTLTTTIITIITTTTTIATIITNNSSIIIITKCSISTSSNNIIITININNTSSTNKIISKCCHKTIINTSNSICRNRNCNSSPMPCIGYPSFKPDLLCSRDHVGCRQIWHVEDGAVGQSCEQNKTKIKLRLEGVKIQSNE